MNSIENISTLFQQEQYSTLSDLLVTHQKAICDYISHNPKQYLKTIPLLATNPELASSFYMFAIYQAYEKGYVTKDLIMQQLGLVPIDPDYIVVNWPERKDTEPLLIRKYPATLNYTEEQLTLLRALPDMGDKVTAAIAKDSVPDLKKLMAEPDFDIDKLAFGHTPLIRAITWDAIECFNFLMINGANRKDALLNAIQYGRREMIELLEQDGQRFESSMCAWAFTNSEYEVGKWLLETGRCDDPNGALCCMSGTTDIAARDLVLSFVPNPPPSYPAWVEMNYNALTPIQILCICQSNPRDLTLCVHRFDQDQAMTYFHNCLRLMPFDRCLLTDELIALLPDNHDISDASTPEALQFCLERFPRDTLHLSKVTDFVVQCLKDGSLTLDGINWIHSGVRTNDLVRWIDAGIPVLSHRFKGGETILHYMMTIEPSTIYIDHFQFAVEHGADPYAKDDAGITPFDIAQEHGCSYLDLFPPPPTS